MFFNPLQPGVAFLYPLETSENLLLPFYTPWKHQKAFMFFDVFRGYRKETHGCNGLKKLFWNIFAKFTGEYLFLQYYSEHFLSENISSWMFLRGEIINICCSHCIAVRIIFFFFNVNSTLFLLYILLLHWILPAVLIQQYFTGFLR